MTTNRKPGDLCVIDRYYAVVLEVHRETLVALLANGLTVEVPHDRARPLLMYADGHAVQGGLASFIELVDAYLALRKT